MHLGSAVQAALRLGPRLRLGEGECDLVPVGRPLDGIEHLRLLPRRLRVSRGGEASA